VTAPRQILPGSTYLVTRRCMQRQLLLRPSSRTNAIVRYVLAFAAHRFGVQLHAACVLSNHLHLVVTDRDARLPAFMQCFCSLVARAVNASVGRWESFWAPGSYSAVPLTSRDEVLAKTVYTLVNPVAAGLVEQAQDWPGVWSAALLGASSLGASRPTFFRPTGTLPEHSSIELVPPPGFASADEFRELLLGAVAAASNQARRNVRARVGAFLGAARVLAQSPFAAPGPGERRRGLRPRICGLDKWKRIESLRRLVEFVDRYRAAREAHRAGNRQVIFPAGTYLMRIAHGVPCAAA
jgi:REP element-mobilizing transposase RayT